MDSFHQKKNKINLNLYNKYRPKKFSEIHGQTEIIEILQEQIKNQKNVAAYLFFGLHGIGKTSVARIFAKAINCENNKNGESCTVCKVCQLSYSNKLNDLIEIDAASNNGVEQMRKLIDDSKIASLIGRYKIYILDEVHMLSKSAFNTFLKLLEEPPKHVIYILATTEIYRIPKTIISRCQNFKFLPLSIKENIQVLQKIATAEEININYDVLLKISQNSGGSVRDSINIMEQIAVGNRGVKITLDHIQKLLNSPNSELVFEFIKNIIEGNLAEANINVDELSKNEPDAKNIFKEILKQTNEILLNIYLADEEIKNEKFKATVKWPPSFTFLIGETALEYIKKHAEYSDLGLKNLLTSLLIVIFTKIHQKKILEIEPTNQTHQEKTKKNENNVEAAFEILNNRDQIIFSKIIKEWDDIEKYLENESYIEYIKAFLTCRLISSSSDQILLLTSNSETSKKINNWKKETHFYQFIEMVFSSYFSILIINKHEFETVKTKFFKKDI